MRKKTITYLTRIVFILCCCHFNISRYLTVKEQVRQLLRVIAMTAKFVSSELSCKWYRDRAFKTIQSLYRNQRVQGEITPNILTQLSKLGLFIVLTMVLSLFGFNKVINRPSDCYQPPAPLVFTFRTICAEAPHVNKSVSSLILKSHFQK